MSVRVRLALLLALAVATSLFIAWFVTRRAVIAPFAREVLEAHLDQVTYVADELEKGGDAAELGRRLGLDIRVRHRPPRFVRRKPRRDRPHPRCEERTHRERHLFVCRGRLAPAAVETSVGWVVVRRDLDVEQPQQRVGWVLLAIAGFVILVAIYAATIATRPLRTTVGAMERMAGGDLSHRLPETGGRELAEV
ncbi:MAG: HAMP domain-containing protein, partial [Deltaproteobacteria bacterium]